MASSSDQLSSKKSLTAAFLRHGFQLKASDLSRALVTSICALRFVHCTLVEIKSNTVFFCKVARNRELANRLEREFLLGLSASQLLKKIKLLTPLRQIDERILIYRFITASAFLYHSFAHFSRVRGLTRMSFARFCFAL